MSFGQTNVMEYENLGTLNLKGSVKTIKETSFKGIKVNGEIVKSGRGWQYDWEKDDEYYFDTIGNLLIRNELVNSTTRKNYSIKLNNKKRITEINRLFESIYYEYDSLNNIIFSKEVNKQPDIISNGHTKPTAGVVTEYKYYYGPKNMLVKKEGYESKMETSAETFKYDAFNNLIECEIKDSDYLEKHKYQYDVNNLLIKYEWSDNEEGTIEITTYEYVNKIKVLEHWVDYEEGKPDGYIDTKFENGNTVESSEAESDGKITDHETCKYEFDAIGNWIRKIVDSNGKYFIVERNIHYY